MPAKPPAKPTKVRHSGVVRIGWGADRLKDVLHGVEDEPPSKAEAVR
jgi:hypothetical protein